MGWKAFLLVLLCFVLGGMEFCLAGQSCDSLLVESRHNTEDLMAYMKVLVDHRVIGQVELKGFISGLESGVLENPITSQQAVGSTHFTHREGIESHFQQGSLDLKVLLNWAREMLETEERTQKSQAETREDTKDPYRKMEFHGIQPGIFQRGEEEKIYQVTLTHPIAVMSTPLTQKHWVEVMGENPSHFKEGADSIILNIKGKPVKLQPDHPVENVTWWSVIEYANRLSIQHGLKPAYDLSDLTLKAGTRAEDGTLDYKGELKINSNSGDIYETEGYRLPTEAEQEYLLKAGGKSTGEYPFLKEELNDYVWHSGNSDRTTHIVGELKPIMINGKAFYDLQGNVWELSQDWYRDYLLRNIVVNPTGPSEGSSRVIRGGGWDYNAHNTHSAGRYYRWPEVRSSYVGARFVRTLCTE